MEAIEKMDELFNIYLEMQRAKYYRDYNKFWDLAGKAIPHISALLTAIVLGGKTK